MRLRSAVLAATLLPGLMLLPTPARAGNFGLMIDAGLRTLSNSPDTEKAIFQSQRGIGAGGGLSYDAGSHWRFGLEGRRVSRDGERAFALDRGSPAFRLGHPLRFTLTEALATASYRFGKIGGISPYAGLGGGFASWKERSDIAGVTESESGTAGLFEGRLGLEREQGFLRLAIEGGITFVPNAVGVGGISKAYEESDLGGMFLVAKIGFSRR